VLSPEGERRYLRGCGIVTLPLPQLNTVLVARKTRSAECFVVCRDAYGGVERYGLFELQPVEEGG